MRKRRGRRLGVRLHRGRPSHRHRPVGDLHRPGEGTNAHHLEAGCLTLACCDLAGFPGEGAPFDKVFAVNVNLFWAKDASREIERLEGLVAPGGRLWLVYEAPDPARMGAELAPSIAERLRRVGFSPRVETTERLCAVIACH